MRKFMMISKRWYEKAANSQDSFDQFISIWISFNAIYGQMDGSEFNKIKSTIKEFSQSDINRILSIEEVHFFCDIDPPIRYINGNQEVVDTRSYQFNLNRDLNVNSESALRNLLYIINKVRNNLFHGDKRIESSRDVEIVKHAYPIIREVVRLSLNLRGIMETGSLSKSLSHPVARGNTQLIEKIEHLQCEFSSFMKKSDSIPQGTQHPISILLDRTNMQANAICLGDLTTQKMESIRYDLLDLYARNKPEVLTDIEEVFQLVDKRMKEVIDNGCVKADVQRFYEEYSELQNKYRAKGYVFKM